MFFSAAVWCKTFRRSLDRKSATVPKRTNFRTVRKLPDAFHGARFDLGKVLNLSGAADAEVNSWHHQSVLEPGRGLRITAHAPDGVIEAVEWTEDSNWIVGVQWHPERMPGDPLAQALFRDLLSAARQAQAAK